MDDPTVPEETMKTIHGEIVKINRYLGNVGALVSLLKSSPDVAGSVLDVGCGHGGLLLELKRRLPIEAVGVDLRVPEIPIPGVRIVKADAVSEVLPNCDVAIATYLIHHLPDEDVVRLIRNIGKSCGRFVFLEPVRSVLSLALFRMFVGPLLHPINAYDGAQTIRRAHTVPEMQALVTRALDGSEATFQHHVAPLNIRQIIDIRFHSKRESG